MSAVRCTVCDIPTMAVVRSAARPSRPPRVAARVRAYAPGRHRRAASSPPARPRPLPPRPRLRRAEAPAPVLHRVLAGLQALEVAA